MAKTTNQRIETMEEVIGTVQRFEQMFKLHEETLCHTTTSTNKEKKTLVQTPMSGNYHGSLQGTGNLSNSLKMRHDF